MSSCGTNSDAADPFAEAYARPEPAYGLAPSSELAGLLAQWPRAGEALDVGAGAGRDSLMLLEQGLRVRAVDRSATGLARLGAEARRRGLADRLRTEVADVRRMPVERARYAVVVATTVLDHLEAPEARRVWRQLVDALAADGCLYVEVHTTDDPGSPTGHGPARDRPKSETAGQVAHYFAPGELLRWAAAETRLRVLRYEERREWDTTHGQAHEHGKASLLAIGGEGPAAWYGFPPRFPEPAA